MYSEQARSDQGRLQAALMPIMVIFVGCVLGLVIMALFAPLVQLNQMMAPY